MLWNILVSPDYTCESIPILSYCRNENYRIGKFDLLVKILDQIVSTSLRKSGIERLRSIR